MAKKRMPAGCFDYIDGAAQDEVTAANNVSSYKNYYFRPRVLRDDGYELLYAAYHPSTATTCERCVRIERTAALKTLKSPNASSMMPRRRCLSSAL